jgi:hypothetical protein
MTQTAPDTDPGRGHPDGQPDAAAPYGHDQMRRALLAVEAIVDSGVLGSGTRQATLLRHIVRAELEGKGPRLKAYSIATDILGRPDDFDPATDSIVRVEMGRLRKALDQYAAGTGRNADVAITLDKGSYRPQISFVQQDTGTRRRGFSATLLAGLFALLVVAIVGAVALWRHQPPASSQTIAAPAPDVLLLPVTNSGPPAWRSLSQQLRFDLASFLAGQPWLNVHLAESPEAARRLAESVSASSTYALGIDLVDDQGQPKLLVTLMTAPTLRVIWNRSYAVDPSQNGLSSAASEVARSVASDVAVVNGAIGQAEIDKLAGRDPVTAEQQRCLLMSRAYWRDYSGALQFSAQTCLEAAIAQDAGFADGLAALALLALDDVRTEPGPERNVALTRASRLVERALGGRRSASVLPETAQLAVTACQGDAAAVVQRATQLVALRPTSDSVLKDAANKVALAAGNWELSRTWLARLGLDGLGPLAPSAALSPMVAAILAERPRDALAAVQPIPQFDFAIGHVLRRASAAASGDADARTDSEHALTRLGYGDKARQVDLVRAQCWRDDIKAKIIGFVSAN